MRTTLKDLKVYSKFVFWVSESCSRVNFPLDVGADAALMAGSAFGNFTITLPGTIDRARG